MNAYWFGLIVLFLVGFAGVFLFLRKKSLSVPEKSAPQRIVGGSPQEPVRRTPPIKPGAPEMEPWLQRTEKAHYVSLKEGLAPISFDQIDETRRRLVEEKLSGLLPLPTSTLKLTNLLRNAQSNAKEISTLASRDPILSARILRVVNSAYFGLPHEVTSIGQAILLLGYNQVKAFLFDDIIQKNLSRLKLEDQQKTDRIWIHSVVVSVCANELGRKIAKDQEADWGTLGLLHDIGKYFLYSLKKIGEPDPSLPTLLGEQRQFGINHAILGGLVAGSWKLPEEIGEIIAFHHQPAFFSVEIIPSHLRLGASVVYLSDHLAKVLGFSDGNDEVYPFRGDFLEYLKLGPDLKNLVTPPLVQAIERAISINEEEGVFPGIREVKGEKVNSQRVGAEPEKDGFLRIRCPKCGYEAAISRDLMSFGEKLIWVCPSCKTRVVRTFDVGK